MKIKLEQQLQDVFLRDVYSADFIGNDYNCIDNLIFNSYELYRACQVKIIEKDGKKYLFGSKNGGWLGCLMSDEDIELYLSYPRHKKIRLYEIIFS